MFANDELVGLKSENKPEIASKEVTHNCPVIEFGPVLELVSKTKFPITFPVSQQTPVHSQVPPILISCGDHLYGEPDPKRGIKLILQHPNVHK